jgi:hypothetical protein
MTSDAVWALVLGAAVTLIATLVAQWSSLAYQTRRQREVRRADFQRTALLQVRDLLGEVDEAMQDVTRIQYGHHALANEWDPLSTFQPAAQAVSSRTFRLRLAAVGLDSADLQGKLGAVEHWAWMATVADTFQDAQDAREKLRNARHQALELLGKQLRELP